MASSLSPAGQQHKEFFIGTLELISVTSLGIFYAALCLIKWRVLYHENGGKSAHKTPSMRGEVVVKILSASWKMVYGGEKYKGRMASYSPELQGKV